MAETLTGPRSAGQSLERCLSRDQNRGDHGRFRPDGSGDSCGTQSILTEVANTPTGIGVTDAPGIGAAMSAPEPDDDSCHVFKATADTVPSIPVLED